LDEAGKNTAPRCARMLDRIWHSGSVEPVISASENADCPAQLMLDVIESSLHIRKSEWIFMRELRVGTGRSRTSLQRLDAYALNCLPHQGMKRVCYEVKASRSDFLCEMKTPLKRRIGMHLSNEFFFVTPPGLLSLDEVPTSCGLIEVGKAITSESKQLVRTHPGFIQLDPASALYCIVCFPAPWRDTSGPTWQFAAAMLRNQQRAMTDRPPVTPKQQKFTFDSGQAVD
jgi:hypothetical protein